MAWHIMSEGVIEDKGIEGGVDRCWVWIKGGGAVGRMKSVEMFDDVAAVKGGDLVTAGDAKSVVGREEDAEALLVIQVKTWLRSDEGSKRGGSPSAYGTGRGHLGGTTSGSERVVV